MNTIRRAEYGITLEEINRRWQETEMSAGLHIARSTFNRQRDAILDIFGIIIECDKKNGFRYPKGFDPAVLFWNNYGILWVEDTPVEKVVIRAFGKQVFYLRDLPMHHSQIEVATEDDYSYFEFTLRPTPDFYTPLSGALG